MGWSRGHLVLVWHPSEGSWTNDVQNSLQKAAGHWLHMQHGLSSDVKLNILIVHGRIFWHEYLIMQGKYKKTEILGNSNFQVTWAQARICDFRQEGSTCPRELLIPGMGTGKHLGLYKSNNSYYTYAKQDKHVDTESIPLAAETKALPWSECMRFAVTWGSQQHQHFLGTLMVSSTPDHYAQSQTGFPWAVFKMDWPELLGKATPSHLFVIFREWKIQPLKQNLGVQQMIFLGPSGSRDLRLV